MYNLREMLKQSARPTFFMPVICSYCGKPKGVKECGADQSGQVSHGICVSCLNKENDKLDKMGRK